MSVGVFVHHPFGVNVLVFAVPVGGGCDGVKWWGAGGMYKGKNSDSSSRPFVVFVQPGPSDEEVREHHTEQ